MGTLFGFRHPQFSEDVAWLPPWLEQHQTEPSDEHIEEAQTHWENWFEGHDQENISKGKDVNLSSRDNSGYKSFHLFLSGEDNSSVSFTPSCGNALHFPLHLSLTGTSQNMSTPLLDASQTEELKSNNFIPMQLAETSAGQGEQENWFKRDHSVGAVNLPSLDSYCATYHGSIPKSLSNDKDSGMKHKENVNLKVDDIDDAVELSVAASEALVIHEIVKSGPSMKSLPVAAVLEVALLVKQARLVVSEETVHYEGEEIDEIDFLSDLDESTMADAFEDVGLAIADLDDFGSYDSISQVKDTSTSEKQYGCVEKCKNKGNGVPEVSCDDRCTKQQLIDDLHLEIPVMKDLSSESFNGDEANKLVDDPALDLNTSGEAHHGDPILTCSFLANYDSPATTERIGFATQDMTSFQPQANANSSPGFRNYENADKDDELTTLVPGKFQSRWLGGWTWKKDINTSAPVEHTGAKSIPGYFVGEKSSLSESADVAPDENSFVQKQDEGFNMVSQSIEGLCNKNNEDILLSQDFVRSSSLSSVDPLCSVVPCSIASENACTTVAHNPNDKVDSGKCCSPAAEHGFENLQRTSSLNVESMHGDQQAVPVTNGDGSRSAVCRRLTSLKTFSVLFPSRDNFVDRESIYFNQFPSNCNMRLLSSKQSMSCNMGSTRSLSFKSTFNCATAKGTEEKHKNLDRDITNQKENYEKFSKVEAEMNIHMQKERNSSLISNEGTCCQFQASKQIVQNFSGEENPEQRVPESDIWLSQSKNFQNPQSKRKKPCDSEIPARKQVRFSETEIEPMHKKNPQKLQFTCRNHSTTSAGRKLKHSNLHSEFRAHDMKRRRVNCPKYGKRLIFQYIEFLLTGFSSQKKKETMGLIRKYGGTVLSDIPSPSKSKAKGSSGFDHPQLPVVLCSKKLQTSKFLYGCAVNASILKVNWLTDSIAAGSVLPPMKYMILSNHAGGKCIRVGKSPNCNSHPYMFERVGIMLHGKHSFCTKLAKIVKHGGGQAFKSLQWLVKSLHAEKISVGYIVSEDESGASRHLKHCALEQKISMMPASWIINSLHAGSLLPFKENNQSSHFKIPVSMELSEEL